MSRQASQNRQLTIRLDEELDRRVQRIAAAEDLSLNQAVLSLLKRAVGLGSGPAPAGDRIGDALDRHFGTWTEAEGREVDRAVGELDRVDPELFPETARKRRAR
jgi:hypothetical protein